MTPELSRRLARALDVGQATLDQRRQVVAAGQGRALSFDDLPDDVRELVTRLEAGPQPDDSQ